MTREEFLAKLNAVNIGPARCTSEGSILGFKTHCELDEGHESDHKKGQSVWAAPPPHTFQNPLDAPVGAILRDADGDTWERGYHGAQMIVNGTDRSSNVTNFSDGRWAPFTQIGSDFEVW